jgi:hypothetical protein
MKPTKHQLFCPLALLGVTLLVVAPPVQAAEGNPRGSPESASSSRSEGSPVLKSLDADMPVVPLTHLFPTPKKHNGVWDLGFRHLACFAFEPPSDPKLQISGERKRIPAEVRAFDGELVRIRGFMVPINQDSKGRTTECIAIRNTLFCCFGQEPAPNEWVLVTIKDPGAEVIENVPVYFYGRLHVGEIYEEGMFAGLYRLECDRVTLVE